MKEYLIIFHLVTGRDVVAHMSVDISLEDEKVRNRTVNELVKDPFNYGFENGKLEIVNMSNVASITVAKAEEEVVE